MKRFIRRARHWIILLLATDAAFIFSTWIIRREALRYMSLFIFLFTSLALAVGLFAEFCMRRKDETVLLDFLSAPNDRTKENLLRRFDYSETVRALCSQFLSELSLVNEKTIELTEYREYIEAWAHEAKTPLSLSALILGNHKDEISPYVYTRLRYIHRLLNDDVERILYYARLQADHPDIRFTKFRLDECAVEALEEYRPLMEEKSVLLDLELDQTEVVSDFKVVSFMLSQIVGNAVKYSDEKNGKILIKTWRAADKVYLSVYNNGDGTPPEDKPFIFDKGFTGSRPNRQKATGMGLYLVAKYAEKLCVDVRLASQIPFDGGFGIELTFVL